MGVWKEACAQSQTDTPEALAGPGERAGRAQAGRCRVKEREMAVWGRFEVCWPV